MNYKFKNNFTFLIGILIFSIMPQTAFARISMLAPTNFTPRTFVEPKYDAFDHDYYRSPRLAALVDTPPSADFSIFTNQPGFQNTATGTVETVFTFDASASTDAETPGNLLEVRWRFELPPISSDGESSNSPTGKPDTYFSRSKSARHIFKKAGIYNVQLEVLDRGGNIASVTKKITIVENTPPIPSFKVEPPSGTENTIFHFDTSSSRDDQYTASYLEYRFDWDGNGKWDTPFNRKTHWYHRFGRSGRYNVTMEARDPGDKKAVFSKTIMTALNVPPKALFNVRTMPGAAGKNYQFDASASSDMETGHRNLLYRWDFNYGGSNDIVYDTSWSHSNKYFGRFEKPGRHIIKLEVQDEDGAVSSAFAEVGV